MARKYKMGPDVKTEEKIYDSKGNLIDENYIERAVEDVHRQLGRGRPSLTAPGKTSPEIKARVPAELKRRVQQAARERGESLSDFIRGALERQLDQAS
jgi:predicted HicB family RNase H-like nuclease